MILCQKLFHAGQRTGDVFLTIGIGNTNVPLPQRAEIRPPNRGHTRLLQQLAGQLLSFPAGLRDIGKGIKGALRRDARDPGDVIELRDHRFAPRVELRHHLSNCGLRTSQRLNAAYCAGALTQDQAFTANFRAILYNRSGQIE